MTGMGREVANCIASLQKSNRMGKKGWSTTSWEQSMALPSDAVRQQVNRVLGYAPDDWIPIDRGYTAAKRYLVRNGARSAFVKIGTTPLTARLLNREIGVYRALSGPFMPNLIGWRTDEMVPILAIEDLSSACWPPPWTSETASLVLEQIGQLHRATGKLERRTLLYGEREAGWPTVANDPRPFLELGLVSPAWLDKALPVLVDAERRCQLDGYSITHLDLRSDNICIDRGVVKFIDWAEACLGNDVVDLGFFLPSLAYEGGPLPDVILPSSPEVAALVSGFFAARAGLPTIPDAPFVRRVQREQLSAALPWAQRQLELPELQ